MSIERRTFLLASLAGLTATSARAEIPLAFKPGDSPLISSETEQGMVRYIGLYRQIAASRRA